MGVLKTIFQTPYGLKPINFRFFVVMNVSYLLGFLIHLAFLVFFLTVRIPFLVVFNVGSCIVFVIAFFLNRKGLHKTAAFLAITEVVVHAGTAIVFLGLESGFGYYIFSLVPITFYIPALASRYKVFATFLLLALYSALYAYARMTPPIVAIDPTVLTGTHYVNLASLIVVLSCLAHYYSMAARHAQEEVERQHRISDGLLLNILPLTIAEELKRTGTVIARKHDQATVLFADIVDFTRLTRVSKPDRIIHLLNLVFTRFDELAVRFGVEKIKTIGDAYMAASGVPKAREDHAEAVAALAIEMLHTVSRFNKKIGKRLIRVRIGIHSGSVISGIIGKNKYTYDLWGDTVNIAARMESLGPEGCIHISDDTFRLIDGKFLVKPRGEIDVKGIGLMRTHFLVGRHGERTIGRAS